MILRLIAEEKLTFSRGEIRTCLSLLFHALAIRIICNPRFPVKYLVIMPRIANVSMGSSIFLMASPYMWLTILMDKSRLQSGSKFKTGDNEADMSSPVLLYTFDGKGLLLA